MYVANSGNGTIAKVGTDGEVTEYAAGLQSPMDVRFDAGGTLYVANQGGDSIVAIAADGQQHVFAKGVANQPQGMKYDDDGDLYVANDDGSLRREAPDGSVTTLATGLSAPRGHCLWANAYKDDASAQPRTNCAMAIYKGDEIFGVSTIGVTLGFFNRLVADMEKKVHGQILIVEPNGTIVSNSTYIKDDIVLKKLADLAGSSTMKREPLPRPSDSTRTVPPLPSVSCLAT